MFTSGATESDNLAIKGVAHFYKKKGKHIVTLKTEHKAVLDSCRQLEREGFEVTYLDPEPNGLVDIDTFRRALRDDTADEITVVRKNPRILTCKAEYPDMPAADQVSPVRITLPDGSQREGTTDGEGRLDEVGRVRQGDAGPSARAPACLRAPRARPR